MGGSLGGGPPGGEAARRGPALGVVVLLLILSEASAEAAQVHCVAGGSREVPLAFHDPATWNPPLVPDATTDVLLDEACHVRCSEPECEALTLKGTHSDGSFEIGPGAQLTLHGCDHASVRDPFLFECGAEQGFTFLVQGSLLYDSAQDGPLLLRGEALPERPDLLRLVASEALAAQPGDWLQVRGGAARGHVYRVESLDFSGCPAPEGCRIDVQLHDPDMEFGHNPDSAGYPTTIGYVGPGGGRVRVAARDHPQYEALSLDRCVEVCQQRSDGECVDAGFIARNHAYVGWTLALAETPPNPATTEAGPRRLIATSYDDVEEQIDEDAGGRVDRLCFAEPLPAALVPAHGFADLQAVVWHGFLPGDPWAIFRPARVRYAGAEGDGGLGFHAACLDADFAYFDNWARVQTSQGTPACQRPFQDTVVTSWHRGLPPALVDQTASCNGDALAIAEHTALSGDRVAIVDTRTAVDTSATCNTEAGPSDPSPDSGHHGVSISQGSFDPQGPPAGWMIRHAGDDGIILRVDTLGPQVFELRDWNWWYMTQGRSGQVVDISAAAPGQEFRIRDAHVTMWTGASGCTAAFIDWSGQVELSIEGLVYVDPQHVGPVAYSTSKHYELQNVLAFGDPEGTCNFLGSGRIRSSWIRGWNRLFKRPTSGLEGVYWAAAASVDGGPVLNEPAEGESVVVQDFVLTGLPDTQLLSPSCASGCGLVLRDGFVSWSPATSALGVGSFDSASVALEAPLEGLLVQGRRLLRCRAAWGESGEHIGRNLVTGPVEGLAILEPERCPLAAPQLVVGRASPDFPYRALVHGERFGPKAGVGLLDRSVAVGAGLEGTFRLAPLACSDRLDNDGDGLLDFPEDPGCTDGLNPNEAPDCDDGVDNDADGRVDFPDDPQCASASGSREQVVFARRCGLGFELALIVPLLTRRLARAAARQAEAGRSRRQA